MEQIAIISDIHGNIPALDVVAKDIQQRGIKTIYCLGDMVGKGPDSAAAVDWCRDQCAAIVQGNWDANIAESTQKKARRWHQDQLGEERLSYLRSLPGAIDFTISGKTVRLFHASQKSIFHRVYFWDKDKILKAMFQNTEFTAKDGLTTTNAKPDVVIYGDIHHAYTLPVNGRLLINTGSVGNPMDGITLAGYIVLTGHIDSQDHGHLGIEFVRLPYDIESAIDLARVAEMPKLTEYAYELRTADHRNNLPQGYTL